MSSVAADPTHVRLHVSGFENALARHPTCTRPTWRRLCERLTTFAFVPIRKDEREKRLRCWSPVLYRQGATRGWEGVELVSCLVLDVDCGASIEAGRAPWMGVAHVVHTSWSHTPEHPRYRIGVPLADPVVVELWPRVWEWASDHAGITIDEKCKDAPRLYFEPAVFSTETPRETHVNEGPILAIDAAALPPTRAEIAAVEARDAARLRAAAWRARAPSRREVADALKTDPAMRQSWGEALGGRCDGRAMRDIRCPSCGRLSVYWHLVPDRNPKALCRHRNTCGASFWLDQLEGA